MLILTAVTTQSNKTVLDKVKATHCYWSHLTEKPKRTPAPLTTPAPRPCGPPVTAKD